MPKRKNSPGQKASKSGQYQELGPRGGKIKEITMVKGKPFPPSQKKGGSYIIVDPTKNKSGLGK